MAWLGRLLAVDFCPAANRWVYWVKHPVACLVLVSLLSSGFALLLRPVAWVVTVAVVFVLLVGCCWPWITVRGLRCGIEFDRSRSTEGEPVQTVLTITSRWPWPAWGLTIDGGFNLSDDNGSQLGDTTATALSRVPGWSTSSWRWEFRPACCGEYPVSTPRISTGFPFGLWRCGRPVDLDNRLLVWPATTPVSILPDACGTSRESDRFSEYLAGEFGDMTGTRPFRDGDSLRRVHWAQTARHDRLVVCERQAAVLSQVEIVLQTNSRLHSLPGPQGTLARAIRIAASLCRAWHAEHAPVVLWLESRAIPLGPGPSGLHAAFDTLARLPHEGTAEAPSQAAVRREASGDGLRVLITTDRDLDQLPYLQRGADTTLTVVLDSGNCRTAGVPPDEPTAGPRHRGVAWLKGQSDSLQEFQREWRRICHAV
ncbi:MAG: DUF58 domain-containing protein [Planctomycetaceae bacterium]|nr:DUF58 domain-containing protein [Planctomycetaceae bacterium]